MEGNDLQQKAKCIIHYESTKIHLSDQLIRPVNYNSWKTLLAAANIRNHEPILHLAENLGDGVIPDVAYHRQCRSLFTMKRELDALQYDEPASEPGCSDHDMGGQQVKRQRISQYSRVYEKVCIFCKRTRYNRRSGTREPLIQAVDTRSDRTLRDIATQRQDLHMLAVTSREIVAAEAHYHRTCYREYTRNPTRLHHAEQKQTKKEDIQYFNLEHESYAELFEFIRAEVIESPNVVMLNSLTDKLTQLMLSKGVDCVKKSTKTHLRRKLEKEFGNRLHIFPDEKGKLLVLPDSLSIFELAKMYQTTKTELEIWKNKSVGDTNTIDKAASIIKMSIKNMENPNHWPHHPLNTNKEAVNIPAELKRFFQTLLVSKSTTRVDMRIESFSQDLIYAVTNGQHKPPKHVLLAYGVKTLTGNVELIRILNRLGHAISYSQLEENDTALCLQKLSATSTYDIVLPANIQPHISTTLAFDNIDRLEETLTGGGTSHRVNGIAVQPRVYGPHPPKRSLPPVQKTKQRSIAVEERSLQCYISGERIGPNAMVSPPAADEVHSEIIKEAQNKNLLWMLARQVNPSGQYIPGWTGFNIRTRNAEIVTQDVLGYLPTINAPATEMATVLEILNQAELMRQDLKLQQIVVVMDQAIYAKATEISWKLKDKFSHIILRMGTFHTIMTVLAILGKRFQDAGLRDICLESDLVAQGSLSAVVEGRAYNRAVRVHKCIYEGLLRVAWKAFMTWVEVNHEGHANRVTSLLNQVSNLHDDLCQQHFESILGDDDFLQTAQLWNEYQQHLRHGNGDLSAFWMSYLDIVGDILLGLIRASREGNWELHLSAIQKLIPWCFAYDRVNYARYLPVYLLQMCNLQEDHPEVHEYLKEGGFTVQLSDNNPFGRVPVDQTIEMTINKDTQTVGGTTGFSLNASAIKRYYLTAEYRSCFLGFLRDMTHTNTHSLQHSDFLKPRIERDEKNVAAVIDVIESWISPFSEDHDLVCISTAAKATQDVRDDLLHAHAMGKDAYNNFKKERLEHSPVKRFHDPLTKQKLKTFSSMSKKKQTRAHGNTIMLKTDRSLFGRIVVIAQSRSLNMKEVFCHPLGPLPWSLSTPEGTPRKTSKAALGKHLQKLANSADDLPDENTSATVIDGMSLVQKVNNNVSTFGDVAAAIHSMICKEASKSTRVDVVFDTYEDMSIKTAERANRGEEQSLPPQTISPTQIVRQWRQFLKQVNNKSSLIEFLVQEWQKTKYTDKLQGKELLVTHLQNCWKIRGGHYEEVPDLVSQHEEADGRLLLHAAHAAASGYSTIVICSEDTDVFVMCLAFHEVIGVRLYQKCGTKTRTRLIDIGKICSGLGSEMCKALIGLHAFTGCDSVSAFAGKGKVRALEIIKKNRQMREALMQMGDNWDISPELQSSLEELVCLLYASKPATANVNELRYTLFCSHKGDIESHQLPPCKDSLAKHLQRANFQAAIWKRCLQTHPQTPSPVGKGWKHEDGRLVIDWMDGPAAPQAVLDLLSCKCSRSCKLPSCECLMYGLKCTDMCRLMDCANQPNTDHCEPEYTEDDDSDEDPGE